MSYKTTAIVFLACLSFQSIAQSDSTKKQVNHYFGLQANQLIRQVLSLGDNNTPVNNPYLVNYSVVSANSGMGINAGIGYIFDEVKTGDDTNELEVTTNDFFFRIGFEKKFNIGKAWLVGLGTDLLIDNEKSESVNKSNTGFGKIDATINDKTSALGTGLRFTINYQISNRILVGTEATYYFKSRTITKDRKIATTFTETDPNTGSEREITRTERTDSEDKTKGLWFNAPTVIWLIIKF